MSPVLSWMPLLGCGAAEVQLRAQQRWGEAPAQLPVCPDRHSHPAQAGGGSAVALGSCWHRESSGLTAGDAEGQPFSPNGLEAEMPL